MYVRGVRVRTYVVCVCMHVRTRAYVRMWCVRVYVSVCMYVRMSVRGACVSVCMYVHGVCIRGVCLCMCVYTVGMHVCVSMYVHGVCTWCLVGYCQLHTKQFCKQQVLQSVVIESAKYLFKVVSLYQATFVAMSCYDITYLPSRQSIHGIGCTQYVPAVCEGGVEDCEHSTHTY